MNRSQILLEDCYVLSIYNLKREGLLRGVSSTTITWEHGFSGNPYPVGLVVDVTGQPYVRLIHEDGNWIPLEYHVNLTETPCTLGGFRYYFICPLVSDNKSCGRRVAKLYLPNGAEYFGCRHCYGLSYKNRNEPKFTGHTEINNPAEAERYIRQLRDQIAQQTCIGRSPKTNKWEVLTLSESVGRKRHA